MPEACIPGRRTARFGIMRPTFPAILLAGALTLSACGGGSDVDLGPVREAIDALDTAQGDLRSRMSDIEQSLNVIGASDGDDDAASSILEQLATLETSLEELRTELTQLGIDREAGDTELRDLVAEVEATLNGVSTTLSTLRNELAELREDHELLKQRFERHLQDHE